MSIIKNTAGQYLYATLVSAVDGSAITTGAALYLSKDGAAQAAATGTLTHKGNGQWECALSQADTNANALGYSWAGTNVVPQGGHIQTVDYPRTAIPAAAAGANDGLPKLSSAGAKLDYAIGATQSFNNTGQTTKIAGTIAAGDIAANAIDAASVKADAVAKIQNGLVLASQMPTNFSALLINGSGHVSRVTLTDTTTTNTDMRGTDNAAPAATALSNVVWTNAKAGYLDVAIGSRSTLAAGAAMTLTLAYDAAKTAAQAGDAMTLSTGTKEDIAVRVEAHLLDEGDSQPLINAMVAAIGNSNVDQTALVAAVRADMERNGGTLYQINSKTTNLPASPAAVSDIPTAAAIATQVNSTLTTAHGSGTWTTAVGFAVPGDAMALTPTQAVNVTKWGGANVTGMPLPTGTYTAPDNAGIDAAKTAALAAVDELAKVPRAGTTFKWTNEANTENSDTVSISVP